MLGCVVRQDVTGCRLKLDKKTAEEAKTACNAPISLNPADPQDMKSCGFVPLIHFVVATHNKQMLDLFIEHGADLQAKDSEGLTAVEVLTAHEKQRQAELNKTDSV